MQAQPPSIQRLIQQPGRVTATKGLPVVAPPARDSGRPPVSHHGPPPNIPAPPTSFQPVMDALETLRQAVMAFDRAYQGRFDAGQAGFNGSAAKPLMPEFSGFAKTLVNQSLEQSRTTYNRLVDAFNPLIEEWKQHDEQRQEAERHANTARAAIDEARRENDRMRQQLFQKKQQLQDQWRTLDAEAREAQSHEQTALNEWHAIYAEWKKIEHDRSSHAHAYGQELSERQQNCKSRWQKYGERRLEAERERDMVQALLQEIVNKAEQAGNNDPSGKLRRLEQQLQAAESARQQAERQRDEVQQRLDQLQPRVEEARQHYDEVARASEDLEARL